MKRWNERIRDLGSRIPYLALTLCPPANTLASLRVVLSMNGRLFMNTDPRIHWSELTRKEQESAVPVVMPPRHMNKRVFLLHTLDKDLVVRVTKENIATFIEFPKFEVYPHPLNRSEENDTSVFSVAMAEFVDEQFYLQSNPKDHIIIVGPAGKKFGLSRSQLLVAKEFMACPTPDSMNLEEVERRGYVVQVPLSYNVYVPRGQLLDVLGSAYVYFGVRRMNLQFDYTISRETLDGGSLVSADHCQIGTEKQLWTVYAILNSTRYHTPS